MEAQRMISDAQAWERWLDWLPTAPPSDRPLTLFAQYRTRLLQGGAAEADVDAEVNILRRMMRTEVGGWQVLFNNIYTSPNPGFNTQPSALLVSAVAGRTPGHALDVSAGQGRNAVFLAVNGWEVTAVDIADEGLKIAARNAERAGVPLRTVLQRLDAYDYGRTTWDVIVLTYAPAPVTSAAYVARLGQALRPGGLVVIESYASAASTEGRKPIDIDPADLQRTFTGFQILHFEDTVALPDWDPQAARLVRLIAQKR